MFRLIPLIIVIIDVVVIVDILKSFKDNEKKILWIVVVVALPVIGPILYYFIGKKNIRIYTRALLGFGFIKLKSLIGMIVIPFVDDSFIPILPIDEA